MFRTFLVLFGALALVGCEGVLVGPSAIDGRVGGGGGGGDVGGGSGAGTGGDGGGIAGGGLGGSGGGAIPTPKFTCSATEQQGTTFPTLRRLTRSELISTWSALVGDAVAQDAMVSGTLRGLPDDRLETLSTINDSVPTIWPSTLSVAAKRSAQLLLADATERTRRLGACTAVSPITETCVRQVATTFGARAWRRDLETAELDASVALFNRVGGGEGGLAIVVRAFLQAPPLSFHFETRGTVQGDRIRLTPFEVASRISYLVTGSMPDDALLTAARTGTLSTREQVRTHVNRLLDTPAGRERVRDFMRYYLQLNQVPNPFGPLANLRQLDTTGLGDELRVEALDYAQDVFFDGTDGTFRQLMTSGRAHPKSERVARIFGQSCIGPFRTTRFEWNHSASFFAPDGAGPGAAVQRITAPGWFVWEFPAGVLPVASSLSIDFDVTSPDGANVTFDVNLNDVPTRTGVTSAGGPLTITIPRAISAGTPLKIGIHVANVSSSRNVQVSGLRVIDESARECQAINAPTHPGLLHRPALLVGGAERTSPILRGAHVRKLFLCNSLPTPDPRLVADREMEVGDVDALPNRERVTTLTGANACTGCHQLVNPLGFPFEAFDQAGMRRTVEQRFDAQGQPAATLPIDVRVSQPQLDFAGGGPTELADSTALAEAMAGSFQARACFTQRAFEYYRRSAFDLSRDGCALSAAERAPTLRDAVLELLTAEDVFFRGAP